MGFKKDIQDCLRDVIRDQISMSSLKDQILETICNMDFHDQIQAALECAVEECVGDYIDSMVEEVVSDVVAQEIEDIFN